MTHNQTPVRVLQTDLGYQVTKLNAICRHAFSVAGSASAGTPLPSDCFDCPEMLQVPGGDFLMGSPHSVTQAKRRQSVQNATPRPPRSYSDICARSAMTREQYAAFVGRRTHHKAGGCRCGQAPLRERMDEMTQPGISAARQSSRCLHQLA